MGWCLFCRDRDKNPNQISHFYWPLNQDFWKIEEGIKLSEELRRGIPKGTIIGYVEFTEEEKERHKRDFERILREMGVLKEDESIDDLEQVNI